MNSIFDKFHQIETINWRDEAEWIEQDGFVWNVDAVMPMPLVECIL